MNEADATQHTVDKCQADNGIKPKSFSSYSVSLYENERKIRPSRPAVKQIIKWQFALKQFAISSLFFCTLLTLHKQERDTNLQRGEVLQVRLQS